MMMAGTPHSASSDCWGAANVCVCVLAMGTREYARIADQTVMSVLEHTPFDVLLALDQPAPLPESASHPRVRIAVLDPLPGHSHRSRGFLCKFDALSACLNFSRAAWVLMLDADALVVRTMDEEDLAGALGGHVMGMAEQLTITGSDMSRKDFLHHYVNHTMVWFGNSASSPPLEDFHYYNAGVVVAQRAEMERLVNWAQQIISVSDKDHEVSGELIADQDYFQYWTNTLHPGCCVTLPWDWNHCEHWDNDFPRKGALILHLSNFCNGPAPSTLERMIEFRRESLRRETGSK